MHGISLQQVNKKPVTSNLKKKTSLIRLDEDQNKWYIAKG